MTDAIGEIMENKQTLFGDLDQVCDANTFLLTNSSSCKLLEIVKDVSEARRQKFCGLHFHDPIPITKICELITIPGVTSVETIKAASELAARLGKTSLECEDTPGFIVDRLKIPYMYEAMRMWERGDGSMRDIDVAMKLGVGYQMGPFELSDHMGLDRVKKVVDNWREVEPDNPLYQ